jgi:hypothetical protein
MALAVRRLVSLGFELEFKVMDAEQPEDADGEFDLVCRKRSFCNLETRTSATRSAEFRNLTVAR